MQFKQFWPMYLRAHQRTATRAMHYLATAVGLACGIAAVVTGIFWLFPLGIGFGYVVAVLSHWLFEGNQPLILVSPFWGAIADLRMCYLALTGRLEADAARHGVVLEQAAAKQDGIAPALRD